MMNIEYTKELDKFCKQVNLTFLRNKSILITGASGLIGSYLVDAIMHSNNVHNNSTKVFAVVRNIERSQEIFQKYCNNPLFTFVKLDISKSFKIDLSVDFIVHAASNANPAAFDSDPIGTIKANVNGTIYILDYAKKHGVKKVLFLSSSEVYGEPLTSGTIYNENSMGIVNPILPRSCYTESKRMAENICVNYNKQFGVATNIVRICFAYGPTFNKTDNRVVPQFIRNAKNMENILLKSSGNLVRSYAYIYDVISGILKILSEGEIGEVYNISNRNSNVSIREIAETVADLAGVRVVFDIPEKEKDKGYSPFSKSLLDSTKLEELGWNPEYDLKSGINQTLKALS